MASPDIPSFRPQTAAPKPAVERGAGLFHAKELTYSKEQLLALRPRSGAAVGATYDGDGLPSGVYSIDPLAPASQPGPLPQLKSVAPLPRRESRRAAARGDTRAERAPAKPRTPPRKPPSAETRESNPRTLFPRASRRAAHMVSDVMSPRVFAGCVCGLCRYASRSRTCAAREAVGELRSAARVSSTKELTQTA